MRLYRGLNLSNNYVLCDRTKHIKIDQHFIREKFDTEELMLPYIKTHDLLLFLPKDL